MSKKRNKRLFPRRMASDYINTNRGIDTNKTQSYDFLNNRSRVRSTKGRRGETEPVLGNTFTKEVPETVSKQQFFDEDVNAWRPTPRRAAMIKAINQTKKGELLLAIYAVWAGQRHHGIVEFQHKYIREWEDYKLILYFAGEEFIFVQETKDKRWISRTYASYLEAMRMYNTKRIVWVISKEKKQ